jgi:Flp pilus assembly protein TadD
VRHQGILEGARLIELQAGITSLAFKAARLKPDYVLAHSNLGLALFRKGQVDEAIREFQEAIHLKPDFAEAHDKLARALAMKNAPAGR